MILNTIKGNTYLYTGGIDSTNYFFTDRESEWLVIIISFPRHPKTEIYKSGEIDWCKNHFDNRRRSISYCF
ncbi:hypothetical protein CHH92_22690 [Bacillus sonorensis]|uniref:Transcriptional regulator n=2 Tax=Bacillus sonorensis TaxID=119858 RepID=M5NYD0_9BACI|nr:hypothetical protein S101395_02715 [Bacillus sonorensis]EME72178.1 transcriptional regulator [Bacillus sonorensis L12]PAD57920.1 hypothetical protein CHH92_22690 [Bacillus sonorensis]RHJ04858.1 hypothetical protein DW143_22910 [Bacillus sonorensis]GIN68437.1 hypothetical protein J41TS2_38580 [Bacillus sonorensis]